MTLWRKTFLLVAVTVGGLLAILYGLSYRIVLQSFESLERTETIKNVERAVDAIHDAVDTIRRSAGDYALWDQTYDFLEMDSERFRYENVSASVVEGLRLDLWLMIHAKEGLRAGIDLRAAEGGPAIPAALAPYLAPGARLVTHQGADDVLVGALLLPGRPLLLVSHPVLPTSGEGPVRGSLVAARTLDAAEVKRLAELTHLSLEIYVFAAADRPPDVERAAAALARSAERVTLAALSPERIAGYARLDDVLGQPALIVRVELARDIYQQGQRSIRYLMLSLLAAGGVFAGLTIVLLDRLVLGRLARLSGEVREIEQSFDLATRVTVSGADEMSQLAKDVNAMLVALQSSRAKETAYLAEIEAEKQRSELLLLNILPEPIADRLKKSPATIADSFAEVTVMFADLVGFTSHSAMVSPLKLVERLNAVFSAFDALAERFGLEKIKTIGDAYMVVGGLPEPQDDHAEAIADMAIAMVDELKRLGREQGEPWQIRIGINTGPVVAGIIGTRKFIYDLWGDAVNAASRMESHGLPDRIQVTESTYERLRHAFLLEERGLLQVKGKGEMRTWFLVGRKPPDAESASERA